MDGCDDEGVKGLGDSENERSTTISNGFDGIDVNLPINVGLTIAEFYVVPKRRNGKMMNM